ncbi:PTS transporter subunit IIC [Anaerococcus porci]|uniref:PTS galactitol transporter subunit IIC n=1 Tax=Anaerococcus porci TaxID=2652269 RepID=UPI002A7643BD|nr:PTS transporter subunit IIC [Anaerococcus porci]MDY3006362.1 PTS transporter subunit IIC [Anaerococcus porci]
MLGQIVNYILGLGAAIFLPIIMIIIGLIFKMPKKRAIISGITLGVAFTGMSLVLDFMFGTISPVAQALVERTGIQLNSVDVGWTPMSAIAWAWPYALLMFPIQIVINLVLIGFKWTDTLNVDMWNVWGKIFTATMVNAISGSLIFGFLAAVIQIVIELKMADANHERIQSLTGIPGVTCTHYMTFQCALMAPVNKILDSIPALGGKSFNSDSLREKIGIFGENSVMGLLVGSLLAIIAGYGLSEILNVGIKVSASLVLFPMVAKLFMQSLQPISDYASNYMKNKYKDREIQIGLDWPFMAGRSEIWVVSIILVPIEIALAFLFAKFGWTSVLPLAGIVNVIVVVPALIVTNGDIIKMTILSVLFTPAYLFVSSVFAPAVTELAKQVGTIEIPAGQFITYFGVEAPIFRWAISEAFAFNIVGIIAIVIFFSLSVIYIKNSMKNKKVDE